MGDMGDYWRDINEFWKARRKDNLIRAENTQFPTGEWTKFTEWHWGVDFLGYRLNYWPTRNKWQWMKTGKVMTGDLLGWMNNRINEANQEENATP